MVPASAVDDAQRIAPHVPRHVLAGTLARWVDQAGYPKVVTRDGLLTSMARDYVRAMAARPRAGR